MWVVVNYAAKVCYSPKVVNANFHFGLGAVKRRGKICVISRLPGQNVLLRRRKSA